MVLQSGSKIGGYVVERPLAQGAMGSVWVARHLDRGHEVALKQLHPALAGSPVARARFLREIASAALIKSPHIVQVHDFGVDDGVPYLTMDLLQGEGLEVRLARQGRLDLEATALILAPLAGALGQLHAAGVVHRDLKPSNVFLAQSGGAEVVKLLDFGIAKPMAQEPGAKVTSTGSFLGTPHYMSPEQIRASKNVDHRADLWSLGVLLYELVTGRLPFTGEDFITLVGAIDNAPIPPPSGLAPGLPPAVDAFFGRALERDRIRRFQTASEMAAAFTALVRPAGPRPLGKGGTLPIQNAGDPEPAPHAAASTLVLDVAPAPPTPWLTRPPAPAIVVTRRRPAIVALVVAAVILAVIALVLGTR